MEIPKTERNQLKDISQLGEIKDTVFPYIGSPVAYLILKL